MKNDKPLVSKQSSIVTTIHSYSYDSSKLENPYATLVDNRHFSIAVKDGVIQEVVCAGLETNSVLTTRAKFKLSALIEKEIKCLESVDSSHFVDFKYHSLKYQCQADLDSMWYRICYRIGYLLGAEYFDLMKEASPVFDSTRVASITLCFDTSLVSHAKDLLMDELINKKIGEVFLCFLKTNGGWNNFSIRVEKKEEEKKEL